MRARVRHTHGGYGRAMKDDALYEVVGRSGRRVKVPIPINDYL